MASDADSADSRLSPTQRRIGADEVARLVAASFGDGVGVREFAPISGGGFASVLRVVLDGGLDGEPAGGGGAGREVVLKVGPAPGVGLLGYERGMLGAEARYLEAVGRALGPDAPTPALLGYGGGGGSEVFDSEWVFMALVPGVNLTQLPGRDDDGFEGLVAPVREALGAAIARVHTVPVPDGLFGYDGGRACGAGWPEAFTAMVESLLEDGEAWGVPIPLPGGAAAVREVTARHSAVLAEVESAVLVHFDLWDGNVLCADGAADDAGGEDGAGGAGATGLRLTGLVDGERWLAGDPLFDFVSPALFRRIEDEPGNAFVRGYAARSGRAGTFTADERVRLGLYRMYLYLLMIVEMPSRGMDAQNSAWRDKRLRELLAEEVGALAAAGGRGLTTIDGRLTVDCRWRLAESGS